MQNVVVIGGGTGSYVVLKGLRKYSDQIKLSAIVTVADSGGSAKQERDEFGILPVSDVRKALLALTRDSGERRQQVLRELFNYRFINGQAGLKGGTFGNLFLVALTNILGSEQAAIAEVEKLLQTEGQVMPVSLTSANLVLEYENGQVIVGEHYLDDFPGDGSQKVTGASLLPLPDINPAAQRVIEAANYIIFPPGDLFASIISNLLIKGVVSRIQQTDASIFYILNLMTKYGQTYKLSALGHLQLLEEYLGKSIDQILLNTKEIPASIRSSYEKENDFPVVDDLGSDQRVLRTDLLNLNPIKTQEGDLIKRSLVRHDSAKIAYEIMELIN